MKVFLRIMVILTTLFIVIYALWPPSAEDQSAEVSEATTKASPPATSSTDHQVIKNLLGGAALESGKKARDKISEVNDQREAEFDDAGL